MYIGIVKNEDCVMRTEAEIKLRCLLHGADYNPEQ